MLRKRAHALITFIVEERQYPAIRESSAAQFEREAVKRLEFIREHASKPSQRAYRQAIVDEIIASWGPSESLRRADLRAVVRLDEEILLAIGNARTEPAADALLEFLDGPHNNRLRAVACLALGLCGQKHAIRKLAEVLLEADGWMRFCAGEALRELTAIEAKVDWIHASSAQRARAAEPYYRAGEKAK